ncbi:MAG: 50S ribosomal protein L10 [Anaerolineae bacterium]|nr:50S ribosomal protein L10 [Anaerolineae bacterium]
MPISRDRKEELVAQYVELLNESSGSFTVVRTQGLPVPRVQGLRKAVLDAGGKYVVAKNTLMKKALEETGYTIPEDLLSGPTAIVFGRENFPGVVKALLDYIKQEAFDQEKVAPTGGVLGGQDIFAESALEEISNMPTLPEIQAQILGLLVQPSIGLVSLLQQANSGVVNVLQAADSGVVNVLQAWIAKQEQEGEQGAA